MNAPYRDVVDEGDLVFLSGQRGISGGPADQTTQALENVARHLESVGLRLANVIKVIVYLSDIDDWDEMNRSYLAAFGDSVPARSSVGITALLSGARIELDVIACRTA